MGNDKPTFLMKKRYVLVILGLFIITLISLRILWMELLQDQKDASIDNGQLDLRDWNATDEEILLLNGDWEFYPFQRLSEIEGDNKNRELIQVPGGWNDVLNPETTSAYGFASYRLTIFVHPEQKMNYSLYISSIRSSSEVYVNGRLLASSGQVSEAKNQNYIAENLPYSTTFTADENGVIEIVIQASNYIDSRNSGIVRSIKFGSEEAISTQREMSYSMQLITLIIILVHSAYALILFLLGNREKKLLYFSLLTFCIAIGFALSTDEKIISFGYDWDFSIVNVLVLIGIIALLQCTEHYTLKYWRRIVPFYMIVTLGTAFLTLFLPVHYVIKFFPLYEVLIGIAFIISIIAFFIKVKNKRDYLLLLLSVVAFVQHVVWSVYWKESDVGSIHYPFDLIIAIGCLASVWFKDYFKVHVETKELAATLQRMNDHKDQFLANTSHEFKNPLHGILNMSESVLQREKPVLQERSVKELETVLSVGRRMTLLLNDLLDVAKFRDGKPQLQKKVVMLQPIVMAVIDMIQLHADAKSIKIKNQIADDFPSVMADENRLVQIVFNLLHNAVKFTNDGEITIKANIKGHYAFIAIADTGIGMTEEMLQRLFLPYEQADQSETLIEGGFGLGLSISKQLVELHGGTLQVSSILGKGSEFKFSLELANLDEEQEKKASFMNHLVTDKLDLAESINREDVTTVENLANRPVILIVDDDPINLQVLETMLPFEKYDVTTTTSSKETLSLLDAKEWDLVISDIMMPQMSGYELTTIIRKRFTHVELPILLLTARSQPSDIESGFLAGANDYVTKPVEALELTSRIESLIMIKRFVKEKLQLEAAWLQAQIQPHFLFNTLNSVIALSEIDLKKMRNLLEEFCDFLRYKFQFQNMDELVSITEELAVVRSYLNIEKVRFGERIQVNWQLEDCENVKVPFLSIQPLVENAVRHGIMKQTKGGIIVIRVISNENYTEIAIEDNGVGMSESKIQQILVGQPDMNGGIGLMNTNQRLKRYFGTGLQIESTIGVGTKISFRIKK